MFYNIIKCNRKRINAYIYIKVMSQNYVTQIKDCLEEINTLYSFM